MKQSSLAQPRLSRLSALLLGSMSLGVAACGAPEEFGENEPTARAEQAIDAGWQTLSLKPGWSNYNGSSRTPSVGKVNGVVTFRGAITGSSSATPVAFTLPSEFRPSGAHAGAADMRTILHNGAGGTVFYNLNTFEVSIYQDGWGTSSLGPEARTMTSLDGVSFDQVAGETLEAGSEWEAQYPFRQDGQFGVFAKTTPDNFVRLQGFIVRPAGSTNPDGLLFNLPPEYRPGNTVYVPVNLAGRTSSQTWSYISIYSDGNVYVPWNVPAANKGTSLEGAWFSKTLSGNETLALKNSWGKYSARSVKVGKYGDVVRFQGAVSGGTSQVIALLPSSMRPSKDVHLVGVANGPAPARLLVKTNGEVQVLSPPLSVATVMVSLDGVSFWL